MLPIRTVLHPTDFSDRAGYALNLATALARDYHARLVILHVIHPPVVAFGAGVVPPDPETTREEARAQLDGLVLPGGLVAERKLLEGDPAAAIVHFARDLPADLVAIGTHGRAGLGRLLMGGVAEHVVRHAPCPVLTASHPFPSGGSAVSAGETLAGAGPP